MLYFASLDMFLSVPLLFAFLECCIDEPSPARPGKLWDGIVDGMSIVRDLAESISWVRRISFGTTHLSSVRLVPTFKCTMFNMPKRLGSVHKQRESSWPDEDRCTLFGVVAAPMPRVNRLFQFELDVYFVSWKAQVNHCIRAHRPHMRTTSDYLLSGY